MPAPTSADVLRELELLVRSRYPLIALVTHEELRAERMLKELGARLGRDVAFWSVTEGWDLPALRDGAAAAPGDVVAALDRVIRASEKRIFVLRDLHPYLDRPEVVRKLRDCVRALRSSYKNLVLQGPVLQVPPELKADATVVDLPLPTAEELAAILDALLAAVPAQRVAVRRTPELVERVVQAALGLTESEGENVFAKEVVSQSSFDEEDLPLILSEKKQILRKSGLLEFFEADESLSAVGGRAGLKAWLREREESFTEKARAYGLPAPRGVLLLGVQGCGKSLTAKAIAAEWRMPLLRLDLSRIFNSFIGASEANMSAAIKVAESLAPAVLWVDEIEKALSGVRSSGSTDSGVTSRIFGTLLTWMQEKTAPVFVVATANQIRDLPPELLRKGRFDEIFFIDLPDAAERAEIATIHLRRRRRDPAAFDVAALASATEGWSGAEIEQAVVAALFATFPKGRDITTADVLDAANQTVPLSTTMAEDLDALRDWARLRARTAR